MRIVALDLIRFFPAMSVVLYHYISPDELTDFPLLSQVTDFGYLGVPLFLLSVVMSLHFPRIIEALGSSFHLDLFVYIPHFGQVYYLP